MKEKLDQGQMLYRMLRMAHSRFGMTRFELGAILLEFKERELWRGRASSFSAFLEEERINSSAAYTYMRVSKRLFRDLQLDDREFSKLATTNMGTLDLACKVITEDNKHEIIDILSTLGERDAQQMLLEYKDLSLPEEQRGAGNKQVNRALSTFFDLPDDLRIEFMNNVGRYYGNGTAKEKGN